MGRIVLILYRVIFLLHSIGIPFIPGLLSKIFIRIPFGCYIGPGARFGRNVMLGYGGLGVVIHNRAVIGDNVVIGTGVTIGGTSKKYDVPIIGDNTMISTGAKIIGPVSIGRNCVVGANAVVIHDIPDNCVAVGVPAKVVKRGIDISDYRDMA